VAAIHGGEAAVEVRAAEVLLTQVQVCFADKHAVELLSDGVAMRFNRLMKCVLEGDLNGNAFQEWEIEILLDIQRCELPYAEFRRAIQRYRRYANRQLLNGAPMPPTFSEYVSHCQTLRISRLH